MLVFVDILVRDWDFFFLVEVFWSALGVPKHFMFLFSKKWSTKTLFNSLFLRCRWGCLYYKVLSLFSKTSFKAFFFDCNSNTCPTFSKIIPMKMSSLSPPAPLSSLPLPAMATASQTQIWLILNKMTKLKKRTWALLTKLQVYASLSGCFTRNYFLFNLTLSSAWSTNCIQ